MLPFRRDAHLCEGEKTVYATMGRWSIEPKEYSLHVEGLYLDQKTLERSHPDKFR
jgi:hypothetical protein